MPDHVVASAGAQRIALESRRRRTAIRRRRAEPYVLIAPAVLFLAAFFAWPALQALVLAFQTVSGTFTLANFQAMVNDTDFGLSVRNTLLLMLLVIPIETCLALVMAVLAQSRLRGREFFLYAWTVPLGVSDLAAGLVWLSILTGHGYLNSFLQDVHLVRHPVGYLSYDNLAGLVASVAIAEVWRSISLVMVVVMSGIQSIPTELGEAAESLGANAWQRFTAVTFPLLKPSLRVALILRTTAAVQIFAMPLALAGSAYPVLAVKSESWASEYQNYQLAACYAVLILVLSSLGTLGYLLALRSPRAAFQR